MTSELSLTKARAKFFEATSDERAVQLEHMKLLTAHVDECIAKGKKEAVYIVPELLTGPFPIFNAAEIAVWLIRQARRGQLDAKLLSADPYTIRLRGWASEDWLDEHQPPRDQFSIERGKPKKSITVGAKPAPARRAALPKKQTPKITPEQASAMAQRGELSARLKHSMSRYRR